VEEVFSHGQSYVGLYRAISANQVRVLVSDTITGKHSVCQNIVLQRYLMIDLTYVKFRVCEKVEGLGETPRNISTCHSVVLDLGCEQL
jgi:hypothetical protein